ncbi:MAG TPA: prepilin-type N-terminal cleavage/methylation domain-containing protein [Usitatibacteraceae bacterium]
MQIPLSPSRADRRAVLVGGFSLIEIAVVLFIISVLVSIVAIPMATQVDQQRVTDTSKQLEIIKEAVIGFAMANGRLPCPATDGTIYGTSNSNGVESPAGGGICTVKLGYVPAVTLGVSPVDSAGFAIDAWGTAQNRIIYAVADIANATGAGCPALGAAHPLTTASGIRAATMDCFTSQYPPTLSPSKLITVCSTNPGIAAGTATACSPSAATLTSSAPFVVISLGRNAPAGGAGADEAHNIDGKLYAQQDLVFVSHTVSAAGTPGGEFDDIVVWPSLNTLFGRMVQANKLP